MLRVLSLLMLLCSIGAYAQVVTPAVELSQVDAAIELVSASLAPDDPLREPLLKSYGEARAALVSIEAYQSNLERYLQAREHALAEAESIQAELAAAQRLPPQDIDLSRSDSLGLQLVTLLVQQLHATVSVEPASSGVRPGARYTIQFSADETTGAAAG